MDDTRAQLIAPLCSASRATSELARDLKVSADRVRWHLERLELEGLVERRMVRHAVGNEQCEKHDPPTCRLIIGAAYR